MKQIGELIQRLRRRAKLTQAELGHKTGVSRDTIARIESGSQKIPVEFLPKLADAFGIKGATLSGLITQQQEPFLYLCRVHDPKTFTAEKRQLFEAWYQHNEIQTLQSQSGAANSGEKIPMLQIPDLTELGKHTHSEAGGHDLALRLREEWNLGGSPIVDPVGLIQDLGIPIAGADLGDADLFGLTGVHGEHGQYSMMINTRPGIPIERQRFSIFHELAHILAHRTDFQGVPDRPGRGRHKDGREKFADAFAAAFQVPDDELRRTLNLLTGKGIRGTEMVMILKQYFRVSYQTILFRLKGIGYLNETSFGPWFGKLQRKFQNAEPEPITDPLNLPHYSLD
ncbi:MAG: ImmA/IrrE family metallo-endopeptidase [Pseudomonadales bacterium]|nr:ImmA/IrrE family metallo-endopeptidase [Pseudomonadales bacterium]